MKSYSNFLLEFVSSTNYHGPINEKIQKCDKGKTLYSCETPSSFCKSNNDFILNNLEIVFGSKTATNKHANLFELVKKFEIVG